MFETNGSKADTGLLEAIWAYVWSISTLVVIAATVAYMVSDAQQEQYAATARLVLEDPRDPGFFGSADANRFLDPESYFPQQAQQLENPTVLEAAAETLGAGVTADQLESVIDASALVSFNTVTVTATVPEPAVAAEYANAVAEAYQQVRARRSQEDATRAIEALQEQIVALQDEADAAEAAAAAAPTNVVAASRANILTERIVALEAQAGTIAAEAAVRDSGVQTFIPAEVPEEPASPLPLRDAAIAAVLAGVLGALFAYRRASSDEWVRSARDVATTLEAPLLGEVPTLRRSDKAGLLYSGNRSATEAFKFVLTSIQYQLADSDAANVLITSAAAGEGKSMLALQTALIACRDGASVILVDADLHAHGLTTMLQSEGLPGLTNVFDGTTSVDRAIRRYRVGDDLVLPALTSGSRDLDASWPRKNQVLRKALDDLRSRAELVIIDSPPLLAVAETTTLANHVDGIVLVIPAGTPRKQLEKLKERLAFTTTPLLGFIYNRASDEAAPYGYGYPESQQARGWWRGRRSKATAGSNEVAVSHRDATTTGSRSASR